MDTLYIVPDFYSEIFEKISRRNWLVHNFNEVNDDQILDFSSYLYNKEKHGVTYTIYLDLNIYQFIINAYKKAQPKDEYRDAIALLVFCHLADIELDPTFAVYEKLNYRTNDEVLNEVLSDLELFHRINNTDNSSIVSFALGDTDSIKLYKSYELDFAVLKRNLTKYERLTEWDSLYLINLFIIYTSLDRESTNVEKFKNVVEWMIKEFRLSLVGIAFAAICFGQRPLKKMMKYKESHGAAAKKNSVFNMTWDLYNLNRFFRMWTERDVSKEGIFASSDKAFNEILRCAIEVQHSGNLQVFGEILPAEVLTYIDKITSEPSEYSERAYDSKEWSPEYRKNLINKYETLIGV